jgi:hypothetical protein
MQSPRRLKPEKRRNGYEINLRAGCPSMAPDGVAPDYSYLVEALTPDSSRAGGR